MLQLASQVLDLQLMLQVITCVFRLFEIREKIWLFNFYFDICLSHELTCLWFGWWLWNLNLLKLTIYRFSNILNYRIAVFHRAHALKEIGSEPEHILDILLHLTDIRSLDFGIKLVHPQTYHVCDLLFDCLQFLAPSHFRIFLKVPITAIDKSDLANINRFPLASCKTTSRTFRYLNITLCQL